MAYHLEASKLIWRKAPFLILRSEGNFSLEALDTGPRVKEPTVASSQQWCCGRTSSFPNGLLGWGGERHSEQSAFKGEEILEKFEGWRYCISFKCASINILSQLFMDCKLLEDRKYICCVHTSGQGLLAQWGLLSFFIIIKIGLHWLWNYICRWLSLKVEKMVLLFREIGGDSGGTWKVPLPWQLRAGLVLRNLISLPYVLRTGHRNNACLH